MFELLIFIVGLYIGYQVGYSVLAWRIKDVLIKEAKSEGLDVSMFEDAKPINTVSQLFVERANNVLYLYDKEANSFICQASTLEDLARLAKEYKNIKYAAVMDEQADIVVAFVDGRVEANLLGKPHES
jgi:hypothetical protein